MIASIHQPNYFPWSGYFHKIVHSHRFVFLDDVQFSRGGFTNRVKIVSNGEQRWLSVPCRPKLGTLILDVGLNDYSWIENHLQIVESSYENSEKYFEIRPFIKNLFYKFDGLQLAQINTLIVRSICEEIGIQTSFVNSSDLAVAELSASSKLAALTSILGCEEYLSGRGGKQYNDVDNFEKLGVRLKYTNFQERPRKQLCKKFIPGMSILDLLFNLGWEGSKQYLLNCDTSQ